MIVDRFGHCIKCGKNLIIERVINMVVKKVTTPDYDQVQFTLNDKSKMRVVMCKACKAILKKKDYSTVMKSVIAGWRREVAGLEHWTKERKEKYMKVYSKKKIKDKVKELKKVGA